MSFSDQEVVAVKRLAERAQNKDCICDLMLNAYDDRRYKVSIAQVMRYIQAEPVGSTLNSDVDALFSLMKQGIEIHDLVDREIIHGLIDDKKHREA